MRAIKQRGFESPSDGIFSFFIFFLFLFLSSFFFFSFFSLFFILTKLKIIVQSEAIPLALQGIDVLCQARSGMGKTAIYVISIINQIDFKKFAEDKVW